MATPYTGKGNAITFASGFVGELLGLRLAGAGRETIPTFHAGTTTKKTFMPGPISEPGTLNVEIHFDPSDTPPWTTTAAEACTIDWGNGMTWATSGFLTTFDVDGPIENKMILSGVIKLSGDYTITTS